MLIPNPKVSIVMSSRNKAEYLDGTLQSIIGQETTMPFEVVVVDDGSTDKTREVCRGYGVTYIHLDNPQRRNPGFARNVGYKYARGSVIISQSDDVIHSSPDTIERLYNRLVPGTFVLASVSNVDHMFNMMSLYVHSVFVRRTLFFLGAAYRSDIYAIGGNDEEFTQPGYDDDWFSDCLMRGLGLKPIFDDTILGYHQYHDPVPVNFIPGVEENPMEVLYNKKLAKEAEFGMTLNPWEYIHAE